MEMMFVLTGSLGMMFTSLVLQRVCYRRTYIANKNPNK